jgi:hypothetical protein
VPSVKVIFWVALKMSKHRCGRRACRPGTGRTPQPVQDHEIAGFDVYQTVADRLDGARGFVAQQERIVVVDATVA